MSVAQTKQVLSMGNTTAEPREPITATTSLGGAKWSLRAIPQPLILPLAQGERTRLQSVVHKLFQLSNGNGSGPRMVMCTSVGRTAESQRICAHLADLLASEINGSVCLVDADFERAGLHRNFDVDNALGFRDLLADRQLPMSSVVSRPMQGNLRVLTAGSGATSQNNISSEIASKRIAELKLLFDFVLISAPAADESPLTISLARLTDGVLVVLRESKSDRGRTAEIKSRLSAQNIRILGAVLSGHTDPVPQRIRSLFDYFRF